MARQPRVILPGYPQHIIQRGNNRDIIFAGDSDYRFYLEKLGDACRRHGCRVHAYVLMTNHVHLLMTPDTETGISKTMQSLPSESRLPWSLPMRAISHSGAPPLPASGHIEAYSMYP